MSEVNTTPQGGRIRRMATAVLGDSGAREIAKRKTEAEAFARNRFTRLGRSNYAYLSSLRDSHKGQRCVIIGNGPSLNETDMGLLRDETTFGLNRIYLMFGRLGFETTYHAVVNRHVVEQSTDDFLKLSAPLFTTFPNANSFGDTPGVGYLNKLIGPRFSTDIRQGIWEGATVTFVAMQIAYFMGFKDVVLVGVDHNFVSKGPAHTLVESAGADPNHFDPNYFGKGYKWQLPDLETSEIAYKLARDAFAKRGGRVVDATVGGKLAVFEKLDLAVALS